MPGPIQCGSAHSQRTEPFPNYGWPKAYLQTSLSRVFFTPSVQVCWSLVKVFKCFRYAHQLDGSEHIPTSKTSREWFEIWNIDLGDTDLRERERER